VNVVESQCSECGESARCVSFCGSLDKQESSEVCARCLGRAVVALDLGSDYPCRECGDWQHKRRDCPLRPPPAVFRVR
jgi:hypothetical protein